MADQEQDAGYCAQCNGSGEGLHDGSTCSVSVQRFCSVIEKSHVGRQS